MTHFDEMKIVGIDLSDPMSFQVVFEVLGDNFNQSYPKRLKHSFRKEAKQLKKWDDGEYEFEKKLRDTYIGSTKRSTRPGEREAKASIEANVGDVDKKLEEIKTEKEGCQLCKENN